MADPEDLQAEINEAGTSRTADALSGDIQAVSADLAKFRETVSGLGERVSALEDDTVEINAVCKHIEMDLEDIDSSTGLTGPEGRLGAVEDVSALSGHPEVDLRDNDHDTRVGSRVSSPESGTAEINRIREHPKLSQQVSDEEVRIGHRASSLGDDTAEINSVCGRPEVGLYDLDSDTRLRQRMSSVEGDTAKIDSARERSKVGLRDFDIGTRLRQRVSSLQDDGAEISSTREHPEIIQRDSDISSRLGQRVSSLRGDTTKINAVCEHPEMSQRNVDSGTGLQSRLTSLEDRDTAEMNAACEHPEISLQDFENDTAEKGKRCQLESIPLDVVDVEDETVGRNEKPLLSGPVTMADPEDLQAEINEAGTSRTADALSGDIQAVSADLAKFRKTVSGLGQRVSALEDDTVEINAVCDCVEMNLEDIDSGTVLEARLTAAENHVAETKTGREHSEISPRDSDISTRLRQRVSSLESDTAKINSVCEYPEVNQRGFDFSTRLGQRVSSLESDKAKISSICENPQISPRDSDVSTRLRQRVSSLERDTAKINSICEYPQNSRRDSDISARLRQRVPSLESDTAKINSICEYPEINQRGSDLSTRMGQRVSSLESDTAKINRVCEHPDISQRDSDISARLRQRVSLLERYTAKINSICDHPDISQRDSDISARLKQRRSSLERYTAKIKSVCEHPDISQRDFDISTIRGQRVSSLESDTAKINSVCDHPGISQRDSDISTRRGQRMSSLEGDTAKINSVCEHPDISQRDSDISTRREQRVSSLEFTSAKVNSVCEHPGTHLRGFDSATGLGLRVSWQDDDTVEVSSACEEPEVSQQGFDGSMRSGRRVPSSKYDTARINTVCKQPEIDLRDFDSGGEVVTLPSLEDDTTELKAGRKLPEVGLRNFDRGAGNKEKRPPRERSVRPPQSGRRNSEENEKQMATEKFDMESRSSLESAWKLTLLLALVALALGFVAGIVTGRFAACPEEETSERDTNGGGARFDARQAIMDAISNANIEQYLRTMSAKPHAAGSPRELYLAKYIEQFWKEAGLDEVVMAPYDVSLSFPDPAKSSSVRLLDAAGHVLYESQTKEAALTPDQNVSGILPPFLAFSPSREVESDLIYVNYARVEDFDWLEQHNVDVRGKIVIARYGRGFRGSKVEVAAERGAIGIILYSDPADYHFGHVEEVYPHSWWLPPTGTQRGTVYTGLGDPFTPGYPSIGTAFRYKAEDVKSSLPKIPAHPISYSLAEKLLSAMGGATVPKGWRGKLNTTYRLGPGFANNTGWKVKLSVFTRTQRKEIHSVFGIIRGAVEPDRYVLFGNHRDAWVFGASDPSGGTAALMEVSRVMGELVKSGYWRPRRSILFCSWGAEEHGIIGSTEWVEHYMKNLISRAAAYINVDVAVQGDYSMWAAGTPLLKHAMFAAADKVPCPLEGDRAAGFHSVYSKWRRVFPGLSHTGRILQEPRYDGLGSSSDFAPFLQKAGVTSVNLGYMFNKTKMRTLESYPLYHTSYETFNMVKNYMDPDFEIHRAVARVTAELTRDLADSVILPFNVSEYAVWLKHSSIILSQTHGPAMASIFGINYANDLTKVVNEFTDETARFQKRVATIDENDSMAVRMVNDQLILLEKAFLDPNGLPLRPHKKHMMFAENSRDSYVASTFPGLQELLYDLQRQPATAARIDAIRHHFSVILYVINSATSTLRDVTGFISSQL